MEAKTADALVGTLSLSAGCTNHNQAGIVTRTSH
jgi:hypothetical protein